MKKPADRRMMKVSKMGEKLVKSLAMSAADLGLNAMAGIIKPKEKARYYKFETRLLKYIARLERGVK